MSGIRVLVIEDDLEFAQQFCRHISQHGGFAPPDCAGSIAEARQRLSCSRYDILAIDLELPDGNGLELVADATLQGKKIIVTVFGDETSVVDAIAAGANGFVLKDAASLVDALLDIHAGHAPLSASVAAHVLHRFRDLAGTVPSTSSSCSILSPRETETLQSLALGHTYKETADKLGISHHTAADHIKNIYRKLAVNSSAAAVYAGISAGLIAVPKQV